MITLFFQASNFFIEDNKECFHFCHSIVNLFAKQIIASWEEMFWELLLGIHGSKGISHIGADPSGNESSTLKP